MHPLINLSSIISSSQLRYKEYSENLTLRWGLPDGTLQQAILADILQGGRQHIRGLKKLRGRSLYDLCDSFDELRDIASLDPCNDFLLQLLVICLEESLPDQVAKLRSDLRGKDIILHLGCKSRIRRARSSIASFVSNTSNSAHVIAVGTHCSVPPNKLVFDWDGEVLYLPVPDSYEYLADKVFYSYFLLYLLVRPAYIIKIDDDHHLSDLSRFQTYLNFIKSNDIVYSGHVLKGQHFDMQQGWHVGKCSNRKLSRMGYQMPFPSTYADGGFGYVLGSTGLLACTRMYLSMQAFFNLNSVQLEDVFVGHALQAAHLPLHDCFQGYGFHPEDKLFAASLPGLRRLL